MDPLSLAIAAARAAPSADNAQPWRLQWQGGRLSVCHRPHPGLDPFGPSGHATLLGIGALAENLAQALPGCASSITLEDLDSGAPYFSLSLDAAGNAPDPGDLPLFKRHTNRFPYGRGAPDGDLLATLANLGEGSVRLIVQHTPASRTAFAQIARICCQARFCNPELHNWLMGSLRFTQAEVAGGDGLDLATLHLPPGGKHFMGAIRPWARMARLNQIGAYRFMALTEILPLRKAPLILGVVGEDSQVGTFSAGRLMERAWIELNALGWGVQPYYVVTDQETRLKAGRLPPAWQAPVGHALAQLPGLLNIRKGERLHMALRVGWPTRNPPRSGRLPAEQLFSQTG